MEADMRYGSLVGGIGLLALTVGCANPTPTDTRDADVRAVKDIEVAWSRDIATKDVDKWASYYADDVSVLMPNAPIMNGKDNVKAALKPMLADPNFALTFQNTRADASKGGDFVYTVGTYSMTVSDPKDQKPVTDKGKYLTVYKKQLDGSWKAVADMINSDMPAPGAPPQ
jgi:ketosteroid isomerase-like protein